MDLIPDQGEKCFFTYLEKALFKTTILIQKFRLVFKTMINQFILVLCFLYFCQNILMKIYLLFIFDDIIIIIIKEINVFNKKNLSYS